MTLKVTLGWDFLGSYLPLSYLQCRDANISFVSLRVCLVCLDVEVVCLPTHQHPVDYKSSLS